MIISVIVPTYRRPKSLARCLEALHKQTRSADEILLIVRNNDSETLDFLRSIDSERLNIRICTVTAPGQIAALNVGLDAARGEIIAFTDDDATPYPDWLERIEEHFLADQQIGGVGGRDIVQLDEERVKETKKVVGKVQWFGGYIGNHHLGFGGPREVDILKGTNMSYRWKALGGIRFDERLHGTGAQVHNDMAFSLTVKRAGWRLIYDPAVSVDHYPDPRFGRDQRTGFNNIAIKDRVHNETFILLGYLSTAQRFTFILWAFFIGSRSSPGFVQLLRFFPKKGLLALRKWFATMCGRWEGRKTWLESSKAKK
ncbi:MAG: glycosyltransferase family 2 protein [Candidatus Omnitrophota bacterium]|nr:MAG: glycosyltransferase family 2 protein [Candidatus Omnitrophota bacterium]